MRKVTQTVGLILIACLGLAAHARDEGDLSIKLEQQKIVVLQGKEARESADNAKPGDTVEYVAEYANKGSKPITELNAIIPVPAGMEYLPATAKPALVQASLNGEKYEAVPLKRKVKLADGKEVEQLVPYKEYRFVRWTAGDLAPGASLKYSLRAKLQANNPEAAVNKTEK